MNRMKEIYLKDFEGETTFADFEQMLKKEIK